MKKKILFAGLVFGLACGACGLAACTANSEPVYTEVVFHLNGGYSRYYDIEDDCVTRQVEEGDKAEFSPISLTKSTWLFDGWYTDEDFENEFESLEAKSTETVHLYAKWTDKVTVTPENFRDYFSVNAQWNGMTVVGRAAVNYSVTPKDGYVFDPIRSTSFIEISATPTLGDSWAGSELGITLGEGNDFSFYGSTTIQKAIQFNIFSAKLEYEVQTPSAELYLLHKDPITVTLDYGGVLENETSSVNGGSVLWKNDLTAPEKEGYAFLGWYTDAEFKHAFDKKLITRPLTLYANWTEVFTLTFDTMGGSEMEPETKKDGYGWTLGEPTKENFGFFGWYTDRECTQKFTDRSAKRSLTIYARWEPYRTVTFDTHGGSEKEALEVLNTTALDENALGSEPTKDGRVFKGWYTDAEYNNKYDGEPITEDTTLHAYWFYQYPGLNQDAFEEMCHIIFDYEFSYEKKLIGNADAIVVHIDLSLKEEYRHCDFNIGLYVDGDFKDGNGTVLKRMSEQVN
ncbi:MAG: InlB B-repeat-containing protein [Clostridia bacterium]|nr:InlB B-repeat-containing protein [Clostridia bacterium]